MRFTLALCFAAGLLTIAGARAGGNPGQVPFPRDYATAFKHYHTQNRAGQPTLAKMYANDVAQAAYRAGETGAPGSILVMEVYKARLDGDGKPVTGADGLYEVEGLAGVAVMERRDNWDAAYPAADRAGPWGFAIYNADGTPKQNDLNCVQCHGPLQPLDYLYTRQQLMDFARQ